MCTVHLQKRERQTFMITQVFVWFGQRLGSWTYLSTECFIQLAGNRRLCTHTGTCGENKRNDILWSSIIMGCSIGYVCFGQTAAAQCGVFQLLQYRQVTPTYLAGQPVNVPRRTINMFKNIPGIYQVRRQVVFMPLLKPCDIAFVYLMKRVRFFSARVLRALTDFAHSAHSLAVESAFSGRSAA